MLATASPFELPRLASELLSILAYLSLPSIPVAVGIAILRYRLYDIDIVINRTLVYGTLTAALGLVYLGGVIVLQYLFSVFAGGESQLAVVASTLAIAALFNPLRRRIQGFIDSSFYRRKYDAAKTLENFSARLRDRPEHFDRRPRRGGVRDDAARARFVVAEIHQKIEKRQKILREGPS